MAMRSRLLLSCAVLLLLQGSIAPISIAAPMAQQQTKEIDRAIEEGYRLFKEGSKKSLIAAIEKFEAVLSLSRAGNNQLKQALAFLYLGRIYNDLGENQKALEYYNHALPLYRAVGNRSGEATTLNNIGNVYNTVDEKQKALQYYNQALSLSRRMGDRSGEATTLSNIGHVYNDLGEKQKALEYYNQALPLSRRMGDRSEEATTLNNIGHVYNDLGEKQKALDYLNQALSLSRRVSNRSRAMMLNNIGYVYNALGEKQKALEYYNQALPITRLVGDRSGEAMTLNNIGNVYNALGQKQKALGYYNQSLPLSREVGDRSGEAMILTDIGSVYNALGEKQKALEYYNQSLPLRRAVGDRSGESRTLNNIGNVYNVLGEKQKALKNYNQSLLLSRAVSDRSKEASTLNKIGNVYDALGENQKALECYNQSLLLHRAVGDREGEALTLNNIGYLFAQKNQTDRAIAFYKKSVNIYESLRADIRSLPRSEQSTYTQTIAYNYRNLADLLIQKGYLSEAQQVIELLKIRELKEIEPNQNQPKTPIRQIPISETEKQEIAQVNPTIADEIEPEALPVNDRLSPNPLNQSAQSLLLAQPNSALIYHLITDKKLWIILATPDGKLQRFASRQNKQQIETLTQQYRTELERCERRNHICGKTATTKLNNISQQLYQQLFPQPLQTALQQAKPTHLTFALDGKLRNIPMGSLHNGKQYLIEQYAISTIIAAQLTDSQDKLPPNPSQIPVLAVGTSEPATIPVPSHLSPNGKDEYQGLTQIRAELDAIVNPGKTPGPFPGLQLFNEKFTLQNIQQQLPQHRLLHIASHAIFRPNSADYSYILTGNQQRWTLTDIDRTTTKLFQNIHMVSISTCQSSLSGRDSNGMEIAGLSHAFLSQGAKSVNATLWKVNDTSTAMLMQHFYQNLAAAPTKAQALQKAQLTLLRTPRPTLLTQLKGALSADTNQRFPNLGNDPPLPSNPQGDTQADYSHPYYWAAFTLIGNSL